MHETETKETSSEQNLSLEALSQIRTPKVGPVTENAHPCEKCVPILKDILYPADLPGQKPYFPRASANLKQLQKYFSTEKSDVDKAAFVKSCIVQVSGNPFTCRKVGMDLPGTLGLLQHQITSNGKKPNKITKFGETFNGRKSHYKLRECGKATSHKHNLVYHPRVSARKRVYEFSKYGKAMHCKYSLVQLQRVHTGERSYDCSECGKSFVGKI